MSLPVQCPIESELVASYHTHPGGRAYPSQTDVQSTLSMGIDVLCVENDKEMKCFRIVKK